MNIRPATSHDIPQLLALERSASGAAHWSERQYRDAITLPPNVPERLFVVAQEIGGFRLQGFLVARYLDREWELENIVVDADTRRRGIGARLLGALLVRAQETNSIEVFLEVRESNQAARTLYEKAGFIETGRRKAYYAEPGEDAILYCFRVL